MKVTKKIQEAAMELSMLVEVVGMEFPDACWKVCQQFKLSSKQMEAVVSVYDAAY